MLTLWESVENKCEGDGSRAALPLHSPLWPFKVKK